MGMRGVSTNAAESLPSGWRLDSYFGVLDRLNGKAHQIQTSEYQEFGVLPVVDQGQEIIVAYSDRIDKKLACPAGGVIVFGDHTCIVKYVDFDFLVGADGTQILTAKKGHVARFYAYSLQRDGVPSTGYNRHFKFLKEREFICPPEHEQRAIAAALSDVDALLDSLARLIAKKRDIKQAVMQQLLTGKTRLPGFKGEWETKSLGNLFTFSGGYSASRDQLSTEGHCYLHYGDIHGTAKTFVDIQADFQRIPKLDIPLRQVSSGSLLDDGDVVFVDASEDDAGTSKHLVVVNKRGLPFISGLHTIVAKPKSEELAHSYRRYCFQTAAVKRQFLYYAVGMKVSGISKSNIPKLMIPVPGVPEQEAIAGVLIDLDAELDALESRLLKTRSLKQAMMQELLTGKTRLV